MKREAVKDSLWWSIRSEKKVCSFPTRLEVFFLMLRKKEIQCVCFQWKYIRVSFLSLFFVRRKNFPSNFSLQARWTNNSALYHFLWILLKSKFARLYFPSWGKSLKEFGIKTKNCSLSSMVIGDGKISFPNLVRQSTVVERAKNLCFNFVCQGDWHYSVAFPLS